ncbi:phosphotransferase [Tessaracoccus antarcticus]|uniref:Aminoglycoside phosphotransferase family protein n=1 Tax=Tessaracoccus antarcticus TaxID=2479848 RepID=A0A3M0GC54_9ACTN|nr:phosphotransferase [Tessaracoccus antarcticus]RMB62515.1 aminoglycoside phosphotransferase family protein [Tessaracoccus antarcticus]
MTDSDTHEQPLPGGDVTDGIVRVGDTVRRPVGEHSGLVHRALEHLEAAGFDGAPRFLGTDDQGREVLSFIDGDVAGRPWPAWVADPARGASVARLLRRLDDSLVLLGLPEHSAVRSWPSGAPEPVGPTATFLGHRDVTPENTVFRDGEAVALIDFDLLRPSSRVDEVANLLLWWAGWMAPEDRDPVFDGVDPGERGRLLVDAYGLSDEDVDWVVPVSVSAAQQSWHTMSHRAEELGGGWRRMWDAGVGDQIRRREHWLVAEQKSLRRALRESLVDESEEKSSS